MTEIVSGDCRDEKGEGYWLQENVTIHLNHLEAGCLLVMCMKLQKEQYADFPLNKKGPNEKKVKTRVSEILLEKIWKALEESQS